MLLLVACSVSGLPHPQGGYNYSPGSGSGGAPAAPAPAAPQGGCCKNQEPAIDEPEPAGSSSNVGESIASRPGNFAASGGGSGGNLQVECKPQQVSPGRYKFVCEGVNKDAISLKSEHILWLQNSGGEQQILDIEVPNYKIEELIKAGFKTTPGQGPKINVLLKKPEQTYDAQVDQPKPVAGEPTVNLQYEAVDKTVVHFPNDKPYSPLQGPILPPLQGAAASRPQRQVPKQQHQKSQRFHQQQQLHHQQQLQSPNH